MRLALELHGNLIENRTDFEGAGFRVFANILGVLLHQQRLHRANFRKGIAGVHVPLNHLGHAPGHHVGAVIAHHDVVQVALHRQAMAQAFANLVEKPLLNADCPAELLEIHGAHDQLIDAAHRKRRDSLELGAQHRAREYEGVAPILRQGLHERDDFRILLYLVDEDEGVALDERAIGQQRDAVDEVERSCGAD